MIPVTETPAQTAQASPGRSWAHIERYLDFLAQDVYEEPITKNHALITRESFRRFVAPNRARFRSALDVGCGQGLALHLFRELGIDVVGVTLSATDAEVCRSRNLPVFEGDQSFLEFEAESFDLVWSRHCLEHSPMPLLTLFEYNRVLRADGTAYIEVPQPESLHIENRNHYSLLSDRGWRNLFKRARFTVEAYHVYTLPYHWPNGLAMDDYYYAYWLRKVGTAPDANQV